MTGPQDEAAGQLPAGLAALAGEADAIDAGAAAGQAGGAAPAGQVPGALPLDTLAADNVQGVGFALAVLREATASDLLWSPPLRTLAERMPDEVVQKLATPWGNLATHYGVNLGGMMAGPWGPALLTLPTLLGIGRALLAEIGERNRRAGPRQVVRAPVADDPGRPE